MRTMNTMAFNPHNDRYWFLAALAFGFVVLPFLVHLTGVFFFGKYASGGALAFFGDFVRGLATMRWYSWSLALGPLAIIVAWRGLWRLTAKTSETERPPRRGSQRSARIDPYVNEAGFARPRPPERLDRD
jgi:hypothetical protein